MKTLVHVGQPKTGSSAIQSFLATNRNHLLENRILVPPYYGGMSHRLLTALFFSDERLKRAAISNPKGARRPIPPRITRLRARQAAWDIRRRVAVVQPEALVLSAEQFSRAPVEASMRRFSRLLEGIGGNLEGLFIIRDPIQSVASAILQRIKARGAAPDRVRWDRLEKAREFVMLWEKLMDGPIHVDAYQPATGAGSPAVDRLLKLASPSLSATSFDSPKHQVNMSISPEAAQLLVEFREANFSDLSYYARPAAVVSLSKRLQSIERGRIEARRRVLHPGIEALIISSSRESVDWFSARGVRFAIPDIRDESAAETVGEKLTSIPRLELIRTIFELDEDYLAELRGAVTNGN